MPPDQGAKFHAEWCAFNPAHRQWHPHNQQNQADYGGLDLVRREEAPESLAGMGNSSWPLYPPFAVLGSGGPDETLPGRGGRRGLIKRQWACPAGTSGCGAIGFQNSCCRNGETCVQVQDTGLGPVGCCPAGATCAGAVKQCTDGSTGCGSDVGGGCCIPGFVCQGVGCKFLSLSRSWNDGS